MAMEKSKELDISSIPVYQPRKYVPEDADLGNVDEVTALYNKLLDYQIDSAQQLEKFVFYRSELEAVLHQYNSLLYIRMTCQTDDQKRAETYTNFIKTIPPAVKPISDKLDRKYLEARAKYDLDEKRYEVYDRDIKADAELFHDENVPLQTEEDLLSQEHQTLCGAMTVDFQGKEHTLPEMKVYLEKTDRDIRESAWRATAGRYLQDAAKLDDIFDKMLGLRQKIAANAGFDNYGDYKFEELHRFDYTPEDCRKYHQAVEKVVIPALAEIYEDRKEKMDLESLRQWDLNVDALDRDPLKPFDTIDEYLAGTKQIFNNVGPAFGKQFQEMIDFGLLDLASRKGKAPGGYQSTLTEIRKPFIFGNVVGTDNDLRLILHEGGHAFHAIAGADYPIYAYRHAPIEFCEVASQAMELFGLNYLTAFYNDEQAKRSILDYFEDVIYLLAWIATIDSFQFWIYDNPDHTVGQRCEAWLEIRNRFGGQLLDYSGLETQHRHAWQRQLHIFQVPFYYIEYGISLLGALGLWLQSKKDLDGALNNYRNSLALGGSRPLPELFAAAGLEFDFSEKTIKPIVDAVQEYMSELR